MENVLIKHALFLHLYWAVHRIVWSIFHSIPINGNYSGTIKLFKICETAMPSDELFHIDPV